MAESRDPYATLPPSIVPPRKPPSRWKIVDVGSLLAQTSPATLNKSSKDAAPSQATVAGENSIIPVVYGQRRIGAKIAGIVVYNGDLILRCVWCQGEIDGFDGIQINDNAVGAGVTVTHYTGAAGQGIDPTLAAAYAAATPPQAYTDTLPGIAYSVVRISPSAAITGFPRVTAILRGMRVNRASLAYVAFNGSQWFATPDSANTSINEDFEIEALISATDWTPASVTTILGKWNSTGNQRSYWFGISNTGALFLSVSTNGTNVVTYTSSVAVGVPDGATIWIKVAFVKNNGVNSTATFYISFDGITYGQLGTVRTAATVATIFDSTTETRLGADAGGGGVPLAGLIWYLRLDTATRRVLDFVPWNQSAGLATWVGDNGETWTGAGGAAINTLMYGYTRTPADALADFIRSPVYGPGMRVDLRSLLQVISWNVETLAGPPPEQRHLIDLALETSMPVEDWINVLRDYAHCWVVPEGGTYYLIRDANDGVDGAFTADEIVAGTLQIEKRSSRNQPTVIEVTWTDTSVYPWRDVRETVYFPGVLGGTVARRMSRISKPGITRRSEAHRYAVERLNDATLSDVTIDFIADDTGTVVRPGGIYNITHPIGFTAKPFRVVRVRPMNGRFRITANEFDPALYSNVVVTQPTIIDTTLPTPNNPPALTGLVATEDVVQTKDGLYISRIRIDWTEPTFPAAFIDSYRVVITDEGTVVHAANVSVRPVVTPSLKELRTYVASVSIISATGVVGPSAMVSITPQGKFLPPSDVTALTGFEAGGRVFLSWAAAVDLTLDTIRYEVRYGPTIATWEQASLLDRVSALTFETPGFPSGTYRFFVKALDSVGNYSNNAAYIDIIVSVDNGAFSAYTYTNQPSELLAMTENVIAGQRIATTDWGDMIGAGHAVDSNITGTWNDGLVTGNTVATQPHRSALLFDTSNYVAIPYASALAISMPFYIESWIYPMSFDATARGIFSARTNNDAGGWDLRLVNNQLALFGTGFIVAQTSTTIPRYQWTHVGARLIAGTPVLYINGQPQPLAISTAYTFINNTAPRWIGAIRTGALFGFHGFIIRTKLWNAAPTDTDRLTSMQYDT